jgi:ABC-2 type transport system ATP-binding protein
VSSANDKALEVHGLTKRYGDVLALDDVSLSVSEGSVYGFLGPNGAGKTTALRILNGLARQDSGEARLFGHAPGTAEARSLSGFLPDVPGFYPWMTAEEYLRFSGGLFGLDRATLDERVRVLLDLSGLAGVKARVGGFSRGMRQRLGIAQALINAPRLLMLDEPTSALDPLGRKDVLDMIASLAGRTTVFFSTHILVDVERVCDTVAILNAGRILTESTIGELKAKYAAHRLEVRVAEGARGLAEAVAAQSWATTADVLEDGLVSIAVSDLDAAKRRIPEMVASRGLALERFDLTEVSLEDVFVELVGGAA